MKEQYFAPLNFYQQTYNIKKSDFICLIYPVSNTEQVNHYLTVAKQNFKKATHYTYAYQFGLSNLPTIKYNDDGEPNGSAGLQIFNAIKQNQLDNTLIIIIRYFGGIKLGLSHLRQAYHELANKIIKEANIHQYHLYTKYQLKLSYSQFNKYQSWIQENAYMVENIQYLEDVNLTVILDNEQYFQNQLEKLINQTIKLNEIDTNYY